MISRFHKVTALAGAIILGAVISSCTGNAPEPTEVMIEGIGMNVTQTEMLPGETLKLSPFIIPDSIIIDKKVESEIDAEKLWKSSNEQVAVVDAQGTVTAIGTGTCNIYYILGLMAAKCEINVIRFNPDQLYGNWTAPQQQVLFDCGNRCTVNGRQLDWSFDGMRVELTDGNGSMRFVITHVDDSSLTFYIGQDFSKTPLTLKYSPVIMETDELLANTRKIQTGSGKTRLAVDMGSARGILWGVSNFEVAGNDIPTQTGTYYAWGDTVTRTVFTDMTYALFDTRKYEYTKYNDNDGLLELQPQDDIATMGLGGSWRTPSKTDVEELLMNSIPFWCMADGVEGILLKSTAPSTLGNCLFLPNSGYVMGDVNRQEQSVGQVMQWSSCYWTSSRGEYTDNEAIAAIGVNRSIDSSRSKLQMGQTKRYLGGIVRPVCSNKQE